MSKAFDAAFCRDDPPNHLVADSVWCAICDRVFWFERLNIICDKFLFTFRSDYSFTSGIIRTHGMIRGRAYCICVFSTHISVLWFFVVTDIENGGLYITSDWERSYNMRYLLPCSTAALYSVDNGDISICINKMVMIVRLWAFAVICAFVGWAVFVAAMINLVVYASTST